MSESIYKHQMEWPHPFIMQMATDLKPRLQGLLRQLSDIEKAPREQQQMAEDEEDDLPAFHCVFRLVSLFVEKLDALVREVHASIESVDDDVGAVLGDVGQRALSCRAPPARRSI